jgi:Cu/Ag efflux protein CusF
VNVHPGQPATADRRKEQTMRTEMTKMKRVLAIPLGIVTALVLAGPALAQTSPSPASPSTTPAEAPKSGAAKHAHLRHVMGEVVSVDASARTLTIKRTARSGDEMNLTVDAAAADQLAGLKPGDRVTVRYARENGELVARSIAPAAHAAQK